MTPRLRPGTRYRRRQGLAVLLGSIAATTGLLLILPSIRAQLDWTATERAGWIAGIVGAVVSGLGTVAALLALRHQRHGAAPASPGAGQVIVVGPIPQAAAWSQARRIQDDLVRAATAGRTTVPTQVLSGMGGVGKTQLAAHLSRQLMARGDVEVLVWVTASGRDSIIAAYAEAAAAVGLAGAEVAPETAAKRLLGWLEHTRRRWLVVLDNLDAPGDASGWWPPATRAGRTVVTTRRRDASLYGDRRRVIEVDPFTAEEATSYLVRATGAGQTAEVSALATDLGHLPLALAQAAAFIRDRSIDGAEYRRRLNDRRRPMRSLVPPDDALPDAHRSTVAMTWSLSIEAADRLAPRGAAHGLISLAALLDPNGIPAGLFTTDAAIDYIAHGAEDEVDAEAIADGLSNLHRLSLITCDPRAGYVRVHALVQRTTRDALDAEHLAATARAAGDALVAIWPETTHDPALNRMARSNALALDRHTGDLLVRTGIHPVLLRAGTHMRILGSITAATDHFERLSARAAAHLNPAHPDRLAVDAELAELRGHAGDRNRAVADLATLLAVCIAALGPDHPFTLRVRHGHAHWTGHAGDYATAISGLDRLLADQCRVLGPDHLGTLDTRGNLAHWRGESGDVAGAAEAFEELLDDRRRILGPDHPRTLIARLSLGYWRSRMDRTADSLVEAEELLIDHVRALGPDHPAVLMNRSNIAHALGEAGDCPGARAAFQTLLDDRLRVLGPDHPHTLTTRVNLAHWRGEVEGASVAVPALTAALADQARTLGRYHPDTLRTRVRLAHWRARGGEVAAAVVALESLLERQIRTLGSNHSDVRATRQVLALWRGVLAGAVPPGHEVAVILGRRRSE